MKDKLIAKKSMSPSNEVNSNAKKRYAFIPLELEKSETALPGEMLVDRSTGDFYVVDDNGNIKSRTRDIEGTVETIIQNNSANIVGDIYNDQRKAYRFFFDESVVRIDRNLKLPNGARYFKLHDMENDKIYTIKPSIITEDAPYQGNLIDNKDYWITFYNVNGDALTQNKFIAKRATSVIAEAVPPDKLLSHIVIETAKDTLLLGESWKELYCKVYAYFLDGTYKNVTHSKGLILERPDLSTVGEKQINALYYNMESAEHCGRYAEDSKMIVVREEPAISIVDVIVQPQTIVLKNGVKKIELSIFAEFCDGTTREITNKCVVTNFNEFAFNVDQLIDIHTNVGEGYVFEDYNLNVYYNTAPVTLCFGDSLAWIEDMDEDLIGSQKLKGASYTVRDAGDLEKYYTPLTELTYDSVIYSGPLRTGSGYIIEISNETEGLLLSLYAIGQYKPESEKQSTLLKRK